MTRKRDRDSVGNTEADILDELRSLSITAAHELLSGFDRLKQLRDDWEIDEDGNESESRKQREKAKALAYELARHEIKHAEKILSLSHAHADMLFEHARRVVQQMKSGASPFFPKREDRPAKVLDLEATRTGSDVTASAKLTITNRFSRDADVMLHAHQFKTRNGSSADGIGRPKTTLQSVPADASREMPLEVVIAAAVEADVYFADLEVALVGDTEKVVARRLLRLRLHEKTA